MSLTVNKDHGIINKMKLPFGQISGGEILYVPYFIEDRQYSV